MLRQLTQEELALLAGVSRAVIARLERPGRACVRMESADRVLRALGIRVDLAPAPQVRWGGRPGMTALH